ncbi:MAG: hypothetical protein HYT73_00060 [Candidatus Aenigmarchaeota archaeon]|nr:hypothetical protein [Candidatus Aenigmarchaeota archaeon]
MKVYQFNHKRILDAIRQSDDTAEYLLGYLSLKTHRFRRQDLISYGLAADDIAEMMDRGTIEEVEVGRGEAISIASYHKMRYDEGHRQTILENLKQARMSQDYETQRMAIGRAAEHTRNRVEERRRLLLSSVILPRFGTRGKDGVYLPPEEVSVSSVARRVRRYPNLLNRYPKGLYHAVLMDVHALGLNVADRSKAQRETWRIRLSEDEALMERCRARMAHATAEKKSQKKTKNHP